VLPNFDKYCRSTSYLRWHSKASFDCLYTLSVTFLSKKYQNPFTCIKVIASQRWDVFETRCSFLMPKTLMKFYWVIPTEAPKINTRGLKNLQLSINKSLLLSPKRQKGRYTVCIYEIQIRSRILSIERWHCQWLPQITPKLPIFYVFGLPLYFPNDCSYRFKILQIL